MSKKNVFKVAGFIGTLGAGAALVATAATGTGAWFTASKDGSLTAQAGNLTLSTSDTTLDFRGIMPGDDKSKTINYTVNASGGNVDVWVKFDTTSIAYSKFTGYKDPDKTSTSDGPRTGQNGYADGGLGRYGHFMVANDTTTLFNSYNLANDPDGDVNDPNGVSGCASNDNGWGSSRKATSPSDTGMGYCGVPGYIKVASNLPSGANRNVTLTFGLTGKQTERNQLQVDGLPFQIVATQAGHRPDAANF